MARTLRQRFFEKFSIGDGCWEWTGATSHGYGQLAIAGKLKRAHRISYELFVGPISEGLVIDHLCRNPSCVRFDHLEPVTAMENTRRGSAGRNCAERTECPQGHPYDEQNTYHSPTAGRQCRTCKTEGKRKYRRARRVAAMTEYTPRRRRLPCE